ncbi:MAG: alanine racemase [Austwickia sp.]|nr:alanine racemase [Austwickia sp.]
MSLSDLAEEFGTPMHFFSPHRLRAIAQDFLTVPPEAQQPHRVFFSYKTAPVPAVLRELHALGVGAEVISEQELELAHRLDVPGSQLIYNGPVKSDASLACAIRNDAFLININHREEIRRVNAAAQGVGKRAQVGLRIGVGIGWASQFGEQAPEPALAACREIVAASHLDLVGLHVHLGFLNSPDQLHHLVSTSADFAALLSRELGVEIQYLDIGGGLWTPSVRHLTGGELRRNEVLEWDLVRPDPTTRYSVPQYVADAHRFVRDCFATHGLPAPQILMEPGRAMCSPAQLLVTQVVGTKAAGDRDYLVLDAGINIADALQGEFHEIFAVRAPRAPREHKYKLVGPICVPSDCIRSTWYGPRVAVGDYLAIMDTGAYFVPWSNSFSFPRPGIVAVENGRARVVRKAECLDYLTALDVPSPARRRGPQT